MNAAQFAEREKLGVGYIRRLIEQGQIAPAPVKIINATGRAEWLIDENAVLTRRKVGRPANLVPAPVQP